MVRSKRATASRNERGSAEDRRRRREWLLTTYRADRDVHPLVEQLVLGIAAGDVTVLPAGIRLWLLDGVPFGAGRAACRCFRCGRLLTLLTLTVDRIVPGCRGGTYRRSNIRPACIGCNRELGQGL
jgi:5-methylcytosine-specific restriction endonuclease McrA